MRNEFSTFHPLVCLAFVAAASAFSTLMNDPALAALSLAGAAAGSAALGGEKAVKFSLRFVLPLFVAVAVLNPLLSHQGFTMLFYIDDNPVTLEAEVFGLILAAQTAAFVLWLSCCVWIFTSDKVIWLFGRVFPTLGLAVSMALRFVPRLCRRMSDCARAQRAVGMGAGDGGPLRRAHNCLRMLSMTATWIIEDPVGTADSMHARGFGAGRRTAFSLFRFTRRDAAALAFIAAASAICAAGCISGTVACQYYPYFKWTRISAGYFLTAAAYAALCAFPAAFEIKEARRWRSLRSEI